MKEKKQQITLLGIVIAASLVILLGLFVWNYPVVSLCIIVLIEAGLSVCMHKAPIWLHSLVVLAQIAVGVFFGKMLFLMVCALFYLVGISALYIWNKE